MCRAKRRLWKISSILWWKNIFQLTYIKYSSYSLLFLLSLLLFLFSAGTRDINYVVRVCFFWTHRSLTYIADHATRRFICLINRIIRNSIRAVSLAINLATCQKNRFIFLGAGPLSRRIKWMQFVCSCRRYFRGDARKKEGTEGWKADERAPPRGGR